MIVYQSGNDFAWLHVSLRCIKVICPSLKSWSQSFRHQQKFHSKCECLMTWSIHPGHRMLASTMKFQ